MIADANQEEYSKETRELLSIVVPCFNEQDTIPLFYHRITAVLDLMSSITYELIFVDDGSSDSTLKVVMELAAADLNTHYISFSRNFGKESALYAGLLEAKGSFVAVMDVDLQDPPELLPKMLELLSPPPPHFTFHPRLVELTV